MNTITFDAQPRTKGIKNSSKKAFRNNQIIGVIYSDKENVPIVFDRHDFEKLTLKMRSNSLLNIKLEGKDYLTFIKEYTFFLKNHRFQHVDFQKVIPGSSINIRIPLEYVGVPLGVSKGGFIQVFSKSVRVKCLSENIPEVIKIDISSLDVNQSIYLKDAPELEGIKYLESPDLALVSVVLSSKKRSEGGAAAAVPEAKAETEKKAPEKK